MMNNQDILDEELTNAQIDIWEAVKWWEHKRIFYNLILVVMAIFIMSTFINVNYSFQFGLFWVVAFCIAANLFFTIGWGVEVLAEYYFKLKIDRLRMLFWVCGILFTLFTTAVFSFAVSLSAEPF